MTSTARTEAEQCPPAMRPSNGGLTLSLQTEKNSKIIHRKRTVPNGQLKCKKEKKSSLQMRCVTFWNKFNGNATSRKHKKAGILIKFVQIEVLFYFIVGKYLTVNVKCECQKCYKYLIEMLIKNWSKYYRLKVKKWIEIYCDQAM